MRPITFVEDVPPAIQNRVRARFADDVRVLQELGFHELCFYGELLGNWSLLHSLLIVLLMRIKNEALIRRPRLQAGAAFLLLRHTEPETIALPMGLGVKFYTGYSDQTVVVTANFASMAVPRPDSGVLKHSGGESIGDAWRRHRDRVNAITTDAAILTGDSFAAFVAMSRREEASVQPPPRDRR